jgi:hypothetical protein
MKNNSNGEKNEPKVIRLKRELKVLQEPLKSLKIHPLSSMHDTTKMTQNRRNGKILST